ncbi:MAG: ABC transporter substrate-binding protein [Burkholderiales bacterium]|nr:ABC transporter substrate-binding protein [Burkholderiales bacterium]
MKSRNMQQFFSGRFSGACLAVAMLFASPGLAQAQQPIRFAVFENLDYPLHVFDKTRHLTGGLLKDFTDQIAKNMNASPSYMAYSRRRIEAVVINGDADMVCYFSPKWADKPDELAWSIAALPQIERVVVLADKTLPEAFPQQLIGKKVAVQIGYHYPQIATQFENGQIKRMDQTDVPGMFRMLDLGGADALITSESEIEGYLKNFPEKRHTYKVSKNTFSIVQTQCALSRKSAWKIEQVNHAIRRMQESGEIQHMMREYGMSDR